MNENIELYSYLVKNEGFYMNQYFSKFLNEEKWICIKNVNNSLYAVIITEDNYEDINISEAREYLDSLNTPYGLNVVVFSKGDYIKGADHYVSRLVYNTLNKEILIKDENTEPLCSILNYIEFEEHEKKKSFNELVKEFPFTFGIILVNIILFIVTAIVSKSILLIDVRVLLEFGAKQTYLIQQGQYWRLITSAFLHGGLIHLLVNMYSLFMVGTLVEKIYGWKKYLGIYFFSAITSSLLSYYLDISNISVGASGAIFGVLGAVLVFAIKERKNIDRGFISNIVSVIVINLLIGLSASNIDNYGHVGGFLGGLVISLILYKRKRNRGGHL